MSGPNVNLDLIYSPNSTCASCSWSIPSPPPNLGLGRAHLLIVSMLEEVDNVQYALYDPFSLENPN